MCYCGSIEDVYHCCLPIIQGRKKALTPEELMRSRYTAYYLLEIKYIAKTMMGRAKENFNPKDAKVWAKKVNWRKLEVLRVFNNQNIGYVEFKASYVENSEEKTLHEISEFKWHNHRWFYVDELQNWPEQL